MKASEMGFGPERPLDGHGPLVDAYNRLGGVMERVGYENAVDVASILAVWSIESGSEKHEPGRAVIRFENHLLWGAWGKAHQEEYDAHFAHGGRASVPGHPWQNQRYRDIESPAGPEFRAMHVGAHAQALEYEVLHKAMELAGEEVALCCISIGGPQILIRNHELIGYETPRDMYDAFQGTEDAHVEGFMAFCVAKGIVGAMQEQKWLAFARTYNGLGQAQDYAAKLAKAHATARAMLGAAEEG